MTDDGELAARARIYREHGQREKYIHLVEGFNYRMDALQAAVLTVKLAHLDGWNERRRALAARYDQGLEGTGVTPPHQPAGVESGDPRLSVE